VGRFLSGTWVDSERKWDARDEVFVAYTPNSTEGLTFFLFGYKVKPAIAIQYLVTSRCHKGSSIVPENWPEEGREHC